MGTVSISGDGPVRGVVSVVIPTRDSEETLPATLGSLRAGLESGLLAEILIADGRSRDATWKIALEFGSDGVSTEPGRPRQLAAGVDAAAAPWLLFLRADTVLEPGWEAEAAAFVADPVNRLRAAAFRFGLDDPSAGARRFETLVRWINRVLRLSTADQGLLVNREYLLHVGGVRQLPQMEDFDLVRRIGRRRVLFLHARAITAARRFRANGYLRGAARALLRVALFVLHVPPALAARLSREPG